MLVVTVLAEIGTGFNSAQLNCFLIGFFAGCCGRYGEAELAARTEKFFYIAAFALNGAQIYISYFTDAFRDGTAGRLFIFFCDYAHAALGCALFFGMKRLFLRLFSNGYPDTVKKICETSDALSYDVYLVHQFLILGPFSWMRLTESRIVNIAAITAAVLALALAASRARDALCKIISSKK